MENKKNKIKDNSQSTMNNKEYNNSNGGTSNNNIKNEVFNVNILNHNESKNSHKLNIIPKTKKKINDKNKLDKKFTTNTSFLDFRKYSNGNNKKIEKILDNSATLNDNNINVVSSSNISNSNLLDKNENIFRKIIKKDNLQNTHNMIFNKINSLYDNNFIFNLKTNKQIPFYDNQNKKDNQLINDEKNIIKYDKIQINNFVNKSKTVNDLGNSHLFRKNSSKILQRFCFICEVFEEKLYRTKNCNHLLCKECLKSYYEQQAEKGIYILKCPKYTCYYNFELKDLKEILSSETYQKYDDYINNKENKSIDNKDKFTIRKSTFDNIIDINLNKKRNSLKIDNNNERYKGIRIMKKNILKTYIPNSINKNNKLMNFVLKEHVIKVSDYTMFKRKVKNEKEIKKIKCSKCGKSTLFSRDDKNFIRCLNCGNAICKYCYKRIGTSNTLKDLNSICGICYSRRRLYTNKTLSKKLLYEILFVISGFIVVWVGFSKYLSYFIVKRKKKKNYYLFITFFTVFLIVNFIIFILFLPYFPIFISIFG